MKFVGRDVDNQRMEIMELEASIHPYYAAVQYHPEYLSRPLRPSPPFLGLILASIHKLSTFIALVSSCTKRKWHFNEPPQLSMGLSGLQNGTQAKKLFSGTVILSGGF